MSLNEIIILAKCGNEQCLEVVVNRFEKTTLKLARAVRIEYAQTDLNIYLLQLIKKMTIGQIADMSEGSLVNYIVNSLKYKSYKIYSRQKNVQTCLLEDIYPVNDKTYDDKEFDLYLSNFVSNGVITDRQLDVLQRKYFLCSTDDEIADALSVSRQAVNKTHNAALKKLRKYLN